MAKQLMFDEQARKKALEGIRKLTRAVAITMGPILTSWQVLAKKRGRKCLQKTTHSNQT